MKYGKEERKKSTLFFTLDPPTCNQNYYLILLSNLEFHKLSLRNENEIKNAILKKFLKKIKNFTFLNNIN